MKDKQTFPPDGRKESQKCIRSRPQRARSNMEGVDVTIFYSSDASEWNNYLMRCFQDLQSAGANLDQDQQQQGGFHVRQQCLENLLPLTMPMIGFYRRAKVQIVILSPDFLDFVAKNANSCLGSVFEPSRVLALMCGVSESEVTAQHRANLVGFDTWKKMTVVENDHEFVMTLMSFALEAIQSCPTEKIPQEVSKAFRLYPSKAREGNAEVMVQLKNPVPENQIVSVSLETENESVPIDAKCPNPYNLRFVVPERFFGFSQYVHVQVKCGSESLGVRPLKCESKMAELHQLLITIVNPLEFICQTVGLSSNMLENVDRILVESFRKNLPKSGFSLFDFDKDSCRRRVADEVPTLLHFAAKMGLQELSTALLDCPGAAAACRVRNARGHGPVDLAQMEGHSCLANMIDNFMKLSETAQMYIYMKSVTDGDCNVDYENLRTAFTQSIEDAGALVSSFGGNQDSAQVAGQLTGHHVDLETSANAEPARYMMPPESSELSEDSKKSTASSSVFYSPSQQELLQLLEDFKSDKYTIDEAESLFDCWQLRQKAHSFKEKQAQLMAMRQKYDVMQKRCQQQGKKSALDRFRTFLMRNMKSPSHNVATTKTSNVQVRSKINEESMSDAQVTSSMVFSNGKRPYSNMSNASSRSSSSLSNRSSTLSALSVSSATDSGAQSDIGEETNCDPTLVHQYSSARQLSRPAVSRMIENLQYMYTPSSINPPPPARNHAATSSSSASHIDLPSTTTTTTTKTFTSSCRGRNPMPVPRVEPSGSPRTSFTKPTVSPTASVSTIPESPPYIVVGNSDKKVTGSPRFSTPSLATNLANECTESTSSSPIRDGYLCMDSNAVVSIRRSKSPLRMQPNDPDYSNVIYGPNGVYMDMSCQGGVSPDNGNTVSATTSVKPVAFSPTMSHPYVNSAMFGDGDFSDRCDSVPDFPAPAPPMTILNRTRPNLPPPLPPRNHITVNRAK